MAPITSKFNSLQKERQTAAAEGRWAAAAAEAEAVGPSETGFPLSVERQVGDQPAHWGAGLPRPAKPIGRPPG